MAVSQSAFGEQRSLSLGRQIMAGLRLDAPLLGGLLLVAGFGLVVLWSAGGQDSSLMMRQLVRLGVAFGVLLAIAQVPPKLLRLWAPWVFAVGLLLLLAVLVAGDFGKGAQRWLDLGIVRFQPSEIMKLAVPMMAAWYLHNRPLPPRIIELLVLLALVAIPVVLIAQQPDLGTALLVGSAGLLVILLGGLRLKLIVLLGAAGAALAPVLWHFMRDYQRQRVLTLFNPESDPLGAGYHIIQSKIAIGSGGLFGKGWGNGSQAQLEFLPERSTDFIFAVLGEEFGLIGLVLLILAYLFLVGRGMYIALQAQDTFARLLAGSISLTFFVYVFVNTGMVTGLLPVVGVPLPLVSYGGTSMVTLMAGFGILMSINGHRNLLGK
ncbi:MAG: rod shape-determining protein RodA [Gammaproteobacteria bacterium]